RGVRLGDLERSVAGELGIAVGDAPPRAGTGVPSIGPRDAAERMAVRVVETVLGRTGLGVTDHLDELAADASVAGRIANELRHATGVEIAPAELRAAPTAEQLAIRLRLAEQAQVGPVRPLRTGGRRPPVFLAHPAGGSTQVYHQLVGLLDPDQKCYGLERLDGGEAVEERAARYVRLV